MNVRLVYRYRCCEMEAESPVHTEFRNFGTIYMEKGDTLNMSNDTSRTVAGFVVCRLDEDDQHAVVAGPLRFDPGDRRSWEVTSEGKLQPA